MGLEKDLAINVKCDGGENSTRVHIEKQRKLYRMQLTLFLSKQSKLRDLRAIKNNL